MNGCLVGFIMGFEEVSGDRSLFSFFFFFCPFISRNALLGIWLFLIIIFLKKDYNFFFLHMLYVV